MAHVNTASVREEVARVEQELAQLSAAGKVSDESRSLIKALLTIVNLLMMVFLEKTTRKTSRNSSKPSSQTDTDQSAPHAKAEPRPGSA